MSFDSMFFFFFTATAPPWIYTLSLHDALPIFVAALGELLGQPMLLWRLLSTQAAELHHARQERDLIVEDRKSTRLNSSHSQISYAVFCLKKKKNTRHRRKDSEQQFPHSHASSP